MKATLRPGVAYEMSYTVPDSKTVRFLYPDAPEFQDMPEVFATGFMVGLMEWTCMKAIEPHLDAGEGSLGTHIDVSHLAPTPPGFTVTVRARCTGIDGRKVWFHVRADDGQDLIGEGRHQRTVVAWDRFNAGIGRKAARLAAE